MNDTMSGAIEQAIKVRFNNVHTALPGQIEKYDYSTQKADVKPLIKKKYVDGTIESLPVIANVPVVWPGGTNSSLTFPLKRGDGVLLIFAERAIGDWLAEGGDAEPEDPRKFDLTDAIAIPGLYPFNRTSQAENNSDVKLQNGTAKLILENNGKIAIGGAEELVDLVEQVVDGLIASVTATALGPQLLSKTIDGTFALIKTKLALIKGSL